MNLRKVTVFLILILCFSNFDSAVAIYKGKSALGNSFVVYLTISDRNSCSGVLINPITVVTAGHCVMPDNILVEPNQVKVFRPGVNIGQTSFESRAIAIKVPEDYDNSDDFTSPNDIAFILLEKSINSDTNLPIADPVQTRTLLTSNSGIFVYGYGRTNSINSSDIPYFYQASVINQRRLAGFGGYEHTYFSLSNDENGAACPGDSGGPVIAIKNNVQYLIGINSGGRGPCNDNGTGSWGATKTIAGQYLYLLDELNQAYEELRPSPVDNLRIEAEGSKGTIFWDAPSSTPRKITGYEVVDSEEEVICESSVTNCIVEFKQIGSNAFYVYALAGEIRSESAEITFEVENAELPKYTGIDVFKDRVLVKWIPSENQGNADENSIMVRIKIGVNGETLCEAQINENGCFFDLTSNSLSLYMEAESNLGLIKSEFAQRFSGLTYVNLITRVTANYDVIYKDLADLLVKNPGYKTLIENFISQLPDNYSEEFIYSDEIWKQSLDLKVKSTQLKIRINSNPKLISIKCVKGKLSKNIKGRAPICPLGFSQK